MLKKAIVRGIIPFVIMTAISILMHMQKIDPFQIRSTFLVGVIISVVASASVIYDIEKWSLRKQSIVHFIIMLFTVFPCLLISGWFDLNSTKDFVQVLGIFLLGGVFLWSIGYFVFGKLLSKWRHSTMLNWLLQNILKTFNVVKALIKLKTFQDGRNQKSIVFFCA